MNPLHSLPQNGETSSSAQQRMASQCNPSIKLRSPPKRGLPLPREEFTVVEGSALDGYLSRMYDRMWVYLRGQWEEKEQIRREQKENEMQELQSDNRRLKREMRQTRSASDLHEGQMATGPEGRESVQSKFVKPGGGDIGALRTRIAELVAINKELDQSAEKMEADLDELRKRDACWNEYCMDLEDQVERLHSRRLRRHSFILPNRCQVKEHPSTLPQTAPSVDQTRTVASPLAPPPSSPKQQQEPLHPHDGGMEALPARDKDTDRSPQCTVPELVRPSRDVSLASTSPQEIITPQAHHLSLHEPEVVETPHLDNVAQTTPSDERGEMPSDLARTLSLIFDTGMERKPEPVDALVAQNVSALQPAISRSTVTIESSTALEMRPPSLALQISLGGKQSPTKIAHAMASSLSTSDDTNHESIHATSKVDIPLSPADHLAEASKPSRIAIPPNEVDQHANMSLMSVTPATLPSQRQSPRRDNLASKKPDNRLPRIAIAQHPLPTLKSSDKPYPDPAGLRNLSSGSLPKRALRNSAVDAPTAPADFSPLSNLRQSLPKRKRKSMISSGSSSLSASASKQDRRSDPPNGSSARVVDGDNSTSKRLDAGNDETGYLIEKIVDEISRKVGGKERHEYKVKWVGWPESAASWIEAEALEDDANGDMLLADYYARMEGGAKRARFAAVPRLSR